MNVGNIQLVTNNKQHPHDDDEVGEDGGYRSQAGSDDYTQPCIVISALRPRTRAVMNLEGDDDLQQQNHNDPPDLLSSNPCSAEEQIEVVKWDDNRGRLPSPSDDQGVVGVVGMSSPTQGGDEEDHQSMAKWQKRHSKMHILSLRFLRWARSITHQADACRRERDVVVVPAHVVAAMQQSMAAGSSASGAIIEGGTNAAVSAGGNSQQHQQEQQQGTRHRRKPSSGLPDVIEETHAPSTPPGTEDNSNNRSRASTESPAFGSTYV